MRPLEAGSTKEIQFIFCCPAYRQHIVIFLKQRPKSYLEQNLLFIDLFIFLPSTSPYDECKCTQCEIGARSLKCKADTVQGNRGRASTIVNPIVFYFILFLIRDANKYL